MSPNSIMPLWQGLLIIGIVVLVTQVTRWLPFIAFSNRTLPPIVVYLGEVLPYAMMGLLVIYCLRNATWQAPNHSLPALVAAMATAIVHYKFGNMLISIALGTSLYMGLLHFIA